MHFDIICIEELDTPRENWGYPDYGDTTLLAHTDYWSLDPSPEKYRQRLIKFEWLKDLFDGIADIAEDGTLKFHSREEIEKKLSEYYDNVADQIQSEAHMTQYKLKYFAESYKDYETLFYYKGTGYTSLEFMDEARFFDGKTLVIGNIYDAHI